MKTNYVGLKPTFRIYKILTLFIFSTLFCSNFSLGQNTAKLNVYFDIDQYNITTLESNKLELFINKLPLDRVTKIKLFGHTDSRQNDAHNQVLSENRVQTIHTIFTELGIDKSKIETAAYGEHQPVESNETDLGRQQNRRTEIIVYYKSEELENVAMKEPEDSPVVATIDTFIDDNLMCLGDTTLVMPNGTLVEFNCEDYLKIKDCFSFQEFITPEAAKAAGLTTMASDGTPLFSAGMFKVTNCEPSVCMKVMIPVLEGSCNDIPCAMSLWQINQLNSWNSMGGTVPIVEVNGYKYYKIEVCGSRMCNLDCKPPKRKRFVSRIKVEKGYHILDAKIYYYEPFSIVKGWTKRKIDTSKVQRPIRKLKFNFYRKYCAKCKDAELYAKVLAPNGDTLIRNYTLAAPYHKRTAFGTCKGNVVKKWFFFFNIKEKGIYRKYFLKRKDYDVCLPSKKKEDTNINISQRN